jgi:tetratricopeptide (TPR) repeat protein
MVVSPYDIDLSFIDGLNMSNDRCAAKTKSGENCKNKAITSNFCHLHGQEEPPTQISPTSVQPWLMRTKFWVVMGPAILTGTILIAIAIWSGHSPQPVQVNNDDAVAVQNLGAGNVDVTVNKIEGLSNQQYNTLLDELDDLQPNREANQKVLNNLLSQIDVKNLSITELQVKVGKYEKRIIELLKDDEVSEDVKSLVLAGKLDEAEYLVDDIVGNQEKELAESYYQQGQVKELRLKYNEVKEAFEKAARMQPLNSKYLNAAGIINQELARHDSAISYFEQALAADVKTYGEDHPNVAIRRNNLGLAYHSLGQYEKAIAYYEQALASDVKTYGEDHPNVAIRRSNLGLAYKSLGQYEKAIAYHEQALASDVKTYGDDHPNVASRRNNLGLAYHSLGQYEKAIAYHEQALASDVKTYGEDHPKVATYRNNLGSAYISLGQYEKAIAYIEQALASDVKTYGEDHPRVASRRNNLGSAYQSLGQYEKAIAYIEQALASDVKTYGEDHPNVAIRRNNLGSAYQSMGQYEKAIAYYEQALASDVKTYGEDHPNVAIRRNNLGLAYHSLGQYEKAIAYFEQALKTLITFLGDLHPTTVAARNNLNITRKKLESQRMKSN